MTGLIGVAWAAIVEIALSIIGKVAFRAVSERFATRLIIYGLEALKNKSTNEVVAGTVSDIIEQLSDKKLKVIEDVK